ncbi:MAG TPA: isoaspartyl peptidase/L-asparaginase [Bacteroidales bacterium]|nr:isoaspartyl peptidase/L-asparaginase [Bacteroidales bacterium]
MYAIAIHGGAGVIDRGKMIPGLEMKYRESLSEALEAGYSVLEKGGSSIDAVTASVLVLEDNILFNAGKGSVFTSEGRHEMDASVMDGKTLHAGAVSGIRNVRNPVLLARAVMEKSEHVFLSGRGAEDFARENGLPFEHDEYFFSKDRYLQLQAAKLKKAEKNMGTVGAVALDHSGNLAAATSTGGLTNKSYGRIGDSPFIGAGTYANNNTCAVSCTGDGEYFIRSVAAYDVSAMVEYAGITLKEACDSVVRKIGAIGGDGGLIAVNSDGTVEMAFNSNGMYRGFRISGSKGEIFIF